MRRDKVLIGLGPGRQAPLRGHSCLNLTKYDRMI